MAAIADGPVLGAEDAGRSLGAVAVIGLGLIGGSLARALRARGASVRAWSASARDREQAAAAGVMVIDGGAPDGAAAATGASVIVLAVPIDQLAAAAAVVVPAADSTAELLHVGSLQRQCALGVNDATFARMLGTHPLAGSHESGFIASRADLFAGAAVSIESRATPRARSIAERLWRAAGAARIQYRSAEEHDRLMVWTSHLPQLTATALGFTLASTNIDRSVLGPGARDTTRLAASPLGLWQGLLRAAPPDLARALEHLEHTVADIRLALGEGDERALVAIWESARAWRLGLGGDE